MHIYMSVRIYVILNFDPRILVFARWTTPSPFSTKLNLLVYQSLPNSTEIELL